MINKLRQSEVRTKSQGMVEFALALPIVLLLVLGIIEFGRLMLTFSAVYSASREAVRYAVAVGMNEDGHPYYQDCTGIEAAAVRVGSFGGVQANDLEIRYDDGFMEIPEDWTTLDRCDDYPFDPDITVKLGDRVLVRVSTQFETIVPIANIPSFPVTSVTARTILTGIDVRGTPLPTSTRVHTYTPTPTSTFTNTPTPTNTSTVTATATETETPTPTATHTEGPSPTPTDTPTITITPTVTETPTITITPTTTSTPTPTFTPTLTSTPAEGACFGIGFNNAITGNDVFTIPIRNGNVGEITARSITVYWPNPTNHLIRVDLSPFYWFGSSSSPWSQMWLIANTAPTIRKNGTLSLGLQFEADYDIVTELPYIEVAFENDCMISWGTKPAQDVP